MAAPDDFNATVLVDLRSRYRTQPEIGALLEGSVHSISRLSRLSLSVPCLFLMHIDTSSSLLYNVSIYIFRVCVFLNTSQQPSTTPFERKVPSRVPYPFLPLL